MKQSCFKFSVPSARLSSRFLVGVCLAVAMIMNAPIASGQTLFGRITGSVTDPSGAAISGAVVTVNGIETKSVRTASTDSNGFYAVTDLAIGHYNVSVTMSGFQKQEQNNLNVVADGRVSADFKLQVGDVSSSVQVVASSAEQINTDSGDLSKTID